MTYNIAQDFFEFNDEKFVVVKGDVYPNGCIARSAKFILRGLTKEQAVSAAKELNQATKKATEC